MNRRESDRMKKVERRAAIVTITLVVIGYLVAVIVAWQRTSP